jgi:LysM repeat protein
MRRQAQDQIVRWVSRSAAVAAGVATLFATGCARNRQSQGLLGARSLVPAPFVEPATGAPGVALPAEPAFAPTTVTPTPPAFDENVVMQPVDDADIKPVKSTTTRPPAPPKNDGTRLTYTVKKGDSLWLVAQMYGVSVAELTAENSIRESKVLKIGQTLTLPRGARLRDVSEIKRAAPKRAAVAPAASKPRTTAASSKPAASTARPAAASPASSTRRTAGKEPIPADGTYTIKSGDNPWDLARKFGVKHEELMQWNNLKSDTVLQVGQKIRLRGGAAEAAPGVSAPAAARAPAVAPSVGPAPATTVLPEAPLAAPADVAPAPGTEAVPGAPAAGAPAVGAPAADGAAAPVLAPGAAAQPGALDLPKKLSHSVTEGETLQIIAEMYGTTVDAIKKENPAIKTDADLLPNLKLMVPYR